MNEEILTKIIKIGNFKNINSLYENGEVYLNTLDFFKKCDNEDARFDKSEGAINIDQVDKIIIKNEHGERITLSRKNEEKTARLKHAYKFEHLDYNFGNIFSASAVTKTNFKQFHKLNPKFRDFGDTILLIENPNKFLNDIELELKKINLNYNIGLVNYYDRYEKNGNLTFYDKPKEYDYQNEIRIFVHNDKNEPLKLRIPSPKSYSVLFKLEEILKL